MRGRGVVIGLLVAVCLVGCAGEAVCTAKYVEWDHNRPGNDWEHTSHDLRTEPVVASPDERLSVSCMPEWTPDLSGLQSAKGDVDGTVSTICEYNGDLYAGGQFTLAGGIPAKHLARWDGASWNPVGDMTDQSTVSALCVYNGELYMGGDFTAVGGVRANCIARWNGVSWQPVGGGMNQRVTALCAYNGDLYAAGHFTTASAAQASYIAKWNGVSWQPVGTGTDNYVFALCVYNGELYAGGVFINAGGTRANYVARWDGATWRPAGTGVGDIVETLCVYNGELYAGGPFVYAGPVTTNHIARWNGSSWQAVGTGTNYQVRTLHVYDGQIYAGGDFTAADGGAVGHTARWNGTSWLSVGTGVTGASGVRVEALCAFNGELYVGGKFTRAGNVAAQNIARWNGNSWLLLGGAGGPVKALCTYNGEIYAGGGFDAATGAIADYIARWDGFSWRPLASGLNGAIEALLVHNGELYAGGGFTAVAGQSARYVARWNGEVWQPLGSGLDSPVSALCIYKGDLYAGGEPSILAGDSCVAKWDGMSWHNVGTGTAAGVHVTALAVVVDELYAGGYQYSYDRWNPVWNYVVRLRGTYWESIAPMLQPRSTSALCAYNGDLYAGGTIVSQRDGFVSRWDGFSWKPVGNNLTDTVHALAVHNGELHAAGSFTKAGSVDVSRIAKWNGQSWQSVGAGIGGIDPCVYALSSCDDGLAPAPALYVGGDFTTAGGNVSLYVARWGCPPTPTSDLTVAVEQAATQADPTAIAPVCFTAVFSRPVADFDIEDLSIGGTAGPTDVSLVGSGTTYDLTVTGMTQSGTVTISIPAGTVHDAAGNPNTPSTSVDNEVTFIFTPDSAPPTVAIIQPTSAPSCVWTCPYVTLAGTADDDTGLAKIEWSNSGSGPPPPPRGSYGSGACTGTDAWTADIPLGPGDNTVTVTATDLAGKTGSAIVTITYVPSAPGSAWTGMAMVSLPIIPNTTDPARVVGFETNGWFAYSPAAGYIPYSDHRSWFDPQDTTPGRGFWAYFPASGSASPCGGVPDQSQPSTIHLLPGWNLIGNPFIKPVKWDLSQVKVQTAGSAASPVAASPGIIATYLWGWNSQARSYYIVCDPAYVLGAAAELSPWQAYWLKAMQECDLILPPP